MSQVPLTVPVSQVVDLAVAPPDPPSFPGFSAQAFDLLERLRRTPNIKQYQAEKTHIHRWLKEPFKAYRDDLVFGFVIPNRLSLETERNVFSRLLKNDFGRGGCHHHFWMSFYRHGWTRLRDLQLIHSLHPDAFYVGISASRISPVVLRHTRYVLVERSRDFQAVAASLVASPDWEMIIRRGDESEAVTDVSPEAAWWSQVSRISALRLFRRFSREHVLRAGNGIIYEALGAVAALWPAYQLLLPDHP